nr:MAG TPA: hypothetical protein [Bacteriophage sp.]
MELEIYLVGMVYRKLIEKLKQEIMKKLFYLE